MTSNSTSQDYRLQIRKATVADRPGIIHLINRVYAEYGDTVCLDGAEADLLTIPDYYQNLGGEFWVLVDEVQNVLGTHAAHPIDLSAGVCGFRRLYLDASLRGTDYGQRLMQLTIDWAWQNNFNRIEFWSDTRFQRAHRFFEKFNFERDGREREMYDGNDPYREYFFFLDRPK